MTSRMTLEMERPPLMLLLMPNDALERSNAQRSTPGRSNSWLIMAPYISAKRKGLPDIVMDDLSLQIKSGYSILSHFQKMDSKNMKQVKMEGSSLPTKRGQIKARILEELVETVMSHITGWFGRESEESPDKSSGSTALQPPS
ncbi:hypothetical protein RJ640_013301 [Escallonia rubra]|uniref:Uncharacterized protein n=1 Tax=Escallonia rubra TaxID=112253 RepID=A0AA88UL59_9ASTE|nr:hypothetical protein RJ640_013301 [Escallonia rubra]